MNEPNVARSSEAQNGRRINSREANVLRAELEAWFAELRALGQLVVAGLRRAARDDDAPRGRARLPRPGVVPDPRAVAPQSPRCSTGGRSSV
jgi:hypothetical protein